MPHDAAAEDAAMTAYARTILALNGLSLSEADLAATIEEFRNLQSMAAPLLRRDLPDRLDLASIFQP